jgi:hypothetical protein
MSSRKDIPAPFLRFVITAASLHNCKKMLVQDVFPLLAFSDNDLWASASESSNPVPEAEQHDKDTVDQEMCETAETSADQNMNGKEIETPSEQEKDTQQTSSSKEDAQDSTVVQNSTPVLDNASLTGLAVLTRNLSHSLPREVAQLVLKLPAISRVRTLLEQIAKVEEAAAKQAEAKGAIPDGVTFLEKCHAHFSKMKEDESWEDAAPQIRENMEEFDLIFQQSQTPSTEPEPSTGPPTGPITEPTTELETLNTTKEAANET